MNTMILCTLLTFCYLAFFYIWGRTFLGLIGAECILSECVCFGFIVMHVVYQAFYLPFFLTRGSYRVLSILWLVASSIITILCLIYNSKTRPKHLVRRLPLTVLPLVLAAVALVVCLCLLIGLHARYYQDDGYYIDDMNKMVNQNMIWHTGGLLDYHRGFSSFFSLFSTPCFITGIRPFYIALFMLRFMGVALTAIVVYRTGRVFFHRNQTGVSGHALALSMIVSLAMMFWSSMYTAQFYWMRTNESKAYCVMVLLPLAFSVSIESFFEDVDRAAVWKKQLAIGLAAIPVAASSMMPYPVLIAINVAALLVHDRFRGAGVTIARAALCVVPNIAYMAVYLLH